MYAVVRFSEMAGKERGGKGERGGLIPLESYNNMAESEKVETYV